MRALNSLASVRRGSFFYGWTLVVALGLTTIVSYGTTQYFFGVLVVPVEHELGGSRAGISAAYSAGLVLAGLLGIPIGRYVDRHGARLAMAAGSAIGGLSLLLLATSRTLAQFSVTWALGVGIAMALTLYPVSFVVVANWFHRRRGRAMAVMTLLGGLASPIFIPLAGWLVPQIGWRGTVVVMGVLQLVVALPLHALLLRRHPEDHGVLPDGLGVPADERADPHGISLRAALRRPAFWTLTAAVALGFLAASVLFAHQVAYMIGRGYDPVLAADLAGLVGVASLPGRLIFNLLSDRVGPQGLLAICCVLQAGGVGLLALATSTAWLIGYVVVYGAAFGAISPLRGSVMAEQFGRRDFGAITALQGLPVAIAAGIGPLGAGWLYDRLGGYEAALWSTAGAFLVAAVAVFVTPRAPAAFAPAPRAAATGPGARAERQPAPRVPPPEGHR